MKTRKAILAILAGILLMSPGCRSGADHEFVAGREASTVIDLPFETAWEAVRDVLLEEKYEIYTRDKRGLFVAYSDVRRRALIVPHRTKLTLILDRNSNSATSVTVEATHQRYGVTLLTYPGWYDVREPDDSEKGQALLAALEAKVTATPQP